MKNRLSISIEEETAQKLYKFLAENKIFRNKSHLVEYALEKLMEEANET